MADNADTDWGVEALTGDPRDAVTTAPSSTASPQSKASAATTAPIDVEVSAPRGKATPASSTQQVQTTAPGDDNDTSWGVEALTGDPKDALTAPVNSQAGVPELRNQKDTSYLGNIGAAINRTVSSMPSYMAHASVPLMLDQLATKGVNYLTGKNMPSELEAADAAIPQNEEAISAVTGLPNPKDVVADTLGKRAVGAATEGALNLPFGMTGGEAATAARAVPWFVKGLGQAVRSGLSMAGGAAGGQVASEFVPDSLKPAAQLGGSLAAGALTATPLELGAKALANRAQPIVSPMTGETLATAKPSNQATVAGWGNEATTPEQRDQIAGVAANGNSWVHPSAQPPIPGYNPTTAASVDTPSPKLNAMGYAAGTLDPTGTTQLHQDNNAALGRAAVASEPGMDSHIAPLAMVQPILNEVNAQDTRFSNAIANLEAQRTRAVSALPSTPGGDISGDVFRQRLAEIYEGWQNVIGPLLGRIDPNATGNTTGMQRLLGTFQNEMTGGNPSQPVGGALTEAEQRIYKDIAALPQAVTVPQIIALKSNISGAMREIAGTSDSADAMSRLKRMQDEATASLSAPTTSYLPPALAPMGHNKGPPLTPNPAPIAQLKEDATNRARYANAAQANTGGVVGAILQRGENAPTAPTPVGEPINPDNRSYAMKAASVIPSILTGKEDQVENVRAVLHAAGNDSLIQSELAAGVIDQLRGVNNVHSGGTAVIGQDGALNAKAGRAWLDNRITKRTLAQLPLEVRARIDKALRSQEALDDEIASQQEMRKRFASSSTGMLVGKDENALRAHVHSLLDDRTPANVDAFTDIVNAVNRSGDPVSINGLKQVVYDYFKTKLGALPPQSGAVAPVARTGSGFDLKSFNDMWQAHNAGLTRLFGGQEYNRIKAVAQYAQRAINSVPKTSAGGQPNYGVLDAATKKYAGESLSHDQHNAGAAIMATLLGEGGGHAALGSAVGAVISAKHLWTKAMQPLRQANIKDRNDLLVAAMKSPELFSLLQQRWPNGQMPASFPKRFANTMTQGFIANGMAQLEQDNRRKALQQSSGQTNAAPRANNAGPSRLPNWAIKPAQVSP